jgi:hypothetical protein
VAAFAIVTDEPDRPVPLRESFSPSHVARVMARLAAAAVTPRVHRSATMPQVLSFMVDDSSCARDQIGR